jgi:predicted DNA-binding transcriptional regulator YafY
MLSALDEAILCILPTEHDARPWMPTPEVILQLRERGHEIPYDKKVLRRLQAMEKNELVFSGGEGKATLWQRRYGLQGIKPNLMSAHEAVAINALRRFMRNKLPDAIVSDLKPLFDAADVRLSQARHDSQIFRAWQDKVASVSTAFKLEHPQFNPEVFRDVSAATLRENEIAVRYRAAYRKDHAAEALPKTLWPLGIVESGDLVYLVAQDPVRAQTAGAASSRTMYRLDRIASVTVSGKRFSYPRDFKLKDYVEAQRLFDFLPEAPVKLELIFAADRGQSYVNEVRIAADQVAKVLPDGRVKVTGTVVPSLKLRWWLRSLGPAAEVVSPRSLRQELAAEFRQLAERYAS